MLTGIGTNLSSLVTELAGVNGSQGGTTATEQSGSFSDAFKSAVQGIDDLQGSADMQVTDLLHGNANADVNRAMVSVEKADVAFQLMMQVRNKVVSAYQDIEKMQF